MKRMLGIVVLTLAVVLATVACGGDDDGRAAEAAKTVRNPRGTPRRRS